MKIIDRFNNYLDDREYKVIINENDINIINYDEIIDFTLNKISVRHKDKLITIEGSGLIIVKMVNDEVLITGMITLVRIN